MTLLMAQVKRTALSIFICSLEYDAVLTALINKQTVTGIICRCSEPQKDGFLSLSLGVRDYIHVVDLAKGHIAALKKLKDSCGCKVWDIWEKEQQFKTHL